MSEQETMRLVAEVVDRYSGPLKSMMDALKKIGDGSKKVHDEGRKHVSEHHKAYHELREQMAKVKETTTDVLRPAFNALGLSALSVAGGIAAISEAVKGFGEYGEKLEFAHRASGLLMNSVRGLAEANQKYGVSTDDTIKSLEQFGAHMDELHRRSPAYINAWKALGANAWRDIGSPLLQLDGNREEQLRRAMETIPRIRDVDQRKRVLGLLGLPENWAYLTDKEMQEMRRKSDEFNRRFPFNAQAAHEAKEAWDELLSTFRGLKDEMSSASAPGITSGLKSIQDFIHDPDVRAIWDDINAGAKKLEETFGKWGINPSLKSDLKDIKTIIDGIKWLFDSKGKLSPGSVKESMQDRLKPFGLGSALDDKKTQESVRKGVADGLTDYFRTWNDAQKLQGGYTPMAFHPGGSAGRGSARGGYFGSKEYPAVDTNGGGAFSKAQRDENGGSPIDGSGGAAYLANRRAAFRKELDDNPDTRRLLGAIISAENPGAGPAVAESLMNRTELVNEDRAKRGLPPLTLKDMIRGHPSIGGGKSFYNPMRNGAINDHLRKMNNSEFASRMNKYIDRALGGSNVIEGHTDQGSRGDPNYDAGGIGKNINGERFNDWGYPGSADFRRRLQAGYEASNRARQRGASLRDMARRGRPATDAELLKRGMKAVDAGALNGNAKLDITLNGFPKGTRTAHQVDGIFKEVQLNRGRPMLQASEIS